MVKFKNTFKARVYAKVKEIPKGKLCTYKIIAKKIDSPQSCRAVGQALSQNLDFINIPCHRVVKSNSEIGGYALGVQNKI